MKRNELTVTEVGARAKSEVEIYRLLTVEGGVYLPPAKDTNFQFLRDIITGSKKVCCATYSGLLAFKSKGY